jgi:hypothetical protein
LRRITVGIEKTEDGKYILKVGDKTVEVDEEELYSRASKGYGAEAKFEEAAKIRTEAETALQNATAKLQSEFAGLLQKADGGDVGAYERVLDMMGVDVNEKWERIQDFKESNEAAEAADRGTPPGKETPPVKGGKELELPDNLAKAANLATALETQGYSLDDVVKILGKADQSQKAGIRDRIFQEMKEVLDKDEKLGKIVSAGGPKADRLVELAQQRVKGRILDGDRSGPELYGKVLQEVKDLLDDFGPGDTPTPATGLGPSPFVSRLTSQAKEPPKAESVTSKNYQENVAQRLAHMVAEGPDEGSD